jgi:putative tryptophan/tyrosine transport system substrate-binding protein
MLGLGRRQFITVLAAWPVAWPLAALAQQAGMPVIGFMSARSPEDSAHLVAAFRNGLAEGGYVEGQNVLIEFRWARGQYDLLPAMAAELVKRRVAVLTTAGGEPSAFAAKRATSTIPIVFGLGGDPVSSGLVESFNRPGANMTGVTLLTALMEPKRLGLLRELVPGVPRVGVLVNPSFPPAARQLQEIEQAARTIDQPIVVARASTDEDLDAAFVTLAKEGVWRAAGRVRSLFRCATRADRRFRGPAAAACHLSVPRICCGRWTAELRCKHHGCLSTVWRLYRADSQWGKARRPTSVAAD